MDSSENGTGVTPKPEESIYDRIGFTGLLDVVWNATPIFFGVPTIYSLCVYPRLLKKSSNLDELLELHSIKHNSSKFYRWFRPRFHTAEEILKEKPYSLPERLKRKTFDMYP